MPAVQEPHDLVGHCQACGGIAKRSTCGPGATPSPGCSDSTKSPSSSGGNGAARALAQRIGVAVDLEQAVAAGGGEQMGRGQKPDAAAEKMRAVAQAGRADPPGERQAGGDAAPFGEIGLDDAQRARGDRRIERRIAPQVLAGRERDRRCLGEALPVLDGAVGGDAAPRARAASWRASAWLIAIASSRSQAWLASTAIGASGPRRRAQRREVGEIELRAEADLQLEGAKARGPGGFGLLLRRDRG